MALKEEGLELFKHLLLLEAKENENLYFLQIGGHDGVTFDPIKAFVEKFGWRGVILEPQPQVFARLKANYRNCSGVELLNIAAGQQNGKSPLYKFVDSDDLPDHATMLASFNRTALEKNGHGYDFPVEEILVETVDLRTLFTIHCKYKVGFLQIDTEGFDYYLVKQLLDFEEELLPSLIRFENYMPAENLAELLRGLKLRGYKAQLIEEYGATDVVATKRRFDEYESRTVPVSFSPKHEIEKGLFHIILLVYNDMPHCLHAIESVLKQTYQNFRLTIVDNGSTDVSHRLIGRYKRDPRIFIFSMPRNQRSEAAQHVAKESNAEYLMFLFADDRYHPLRLEVASRKLSENPNAAYLFFNSRFVDEAGRPIKEVPITQFSGDISSMDRFDHLRHFLSPGNSLHPCGMVVRSDVYRQLGGFPTMMHRIGDMTFFARLLGSYDGLFLADRMQLITLWTHGRNESHTNDLTTNQLVFERSMFLERYLEPGIFQNLEKIFESKQSDGIVLHNRVERLWYLAHHILTINAPDYQLFGHRLLYEAAMEGDENFEQAILKTTGLTVSEYVTEKSGKTALDFAMFGRGALQTSLGSQISSLRSQMSSLGSHLASLESQVRLVIEEAQGESFLESFFHPTVALEVAKFLLSIGLRGPGRVLYNRAVIRQKARASLS